MYILGIDTTFHSTAISLVGNDNRVKLIKSIAIDFSDQNADKFFNAHIGNLIVLLKGIKELLWDKIGLISVINEEGAFHSVPIGVTAACVLGQLKNKKVVGVNHEIAHLYSVWIERQPDEFRFPIVSLSVSGAHSAIYFQKNHCQINKVSSISWGCEKNSFQGIAALFDYFCSQVKIDIPTKGVGGIIISYLAQKGEISNFPEFNKIRIRHKKDKIIICGVDKAVREIYLNHKKMLPNKIFQQNVARNFLNCIFGLLGQEFLKCAISSGPKEMHLVGGVSANRNFQEIIKRIALKNGFNFKAPVNEDFCGDNAAMVAVRGRYESAFLKGRDVIYVKPSQWYYRYYCEKCL